MTKPAAINDAFARFWAAYPKRPQNPRAEALARFTKLVKAGEDPEALIGAAAAFAADPATRKVDPIYLPYASTWLAKRRFEDFPASAPSAPSPEGPAGDPALAFLRPIAGPADFAAWIAPLRVETRGEDLVVIGPTQFGLQRVQKTYGREITAELGPVDYIVERKGS